MLEESKFKFLGYRISRVDLNINDDYEPKENKKIDINTKYLIDKNNSNMVVVIMEVLVETNKKDFKLYIQIKGFFQKDSNMDDNLFTKLYTQNAPAILFPFVRAIVSTYTAQANIPPILLPSINFSKNK
jgi:preprotein translocase subunit SecB